MTADIIDVADDTERAGTDGVTAPDHEHGPDCNHGSAGTGDATRSRLALAAVMVGAGVLHFVVPGFYERIIPRFLGHERALVYGSGVVELACGALLVVPRTKRLGAWLTLAVFVLVYPANIQMALDAGRPVDAASAVAWARLPLQFPLLAWAYRRATR